MTRRLYVAAYQGKAWRVIRAHKDEVKDAASFARTVGTPAAFAVIGPFRTRAAADLCAEARGMGRCATVAEYERAVHA
jgi:hypothetical protein